MVEFNMQAVLYESPTWPQQICAARETLLQFRRPDQERLRARHGHTVAKFAFEIYLMKKEHGLILVLKAINNNQ